MRKGAARAVRDHPGHRGGRPRGWTLLEVVVASLLISLGLMVVVGLIPMGVTSLRKSEALQAATLYAVEVLEDAERPTFEPLPDRLYLDRIVPINEVRFRVERQIYGVDGETPPRLYDVVVRVSWEPQPVPVVLRTRVYHP